MNQGTTRRTQAWRIAVLAALVAIPFAMDSASAGVPELHSPEEEFAPVGASPAAKPVDAVAEDFIRFCLDTDGGGEEVRAAAQRAGLPPIPRDELEAMSRFSGEGWITRTGPLAVVLILADTGACTVRCWGVSFTNPRALTAHCHDAAGTDRGNAERRTAGQ